MCRSRYDILNGPIYTGLFQKNALSFDLFFDANIAGKRFLFSHAGITSRWLSAVGKGNLDQTLQWIKTGFMEFCLDRTKDEVWGYLAHIGEERGGNSQSGSIIWADLFEHMDKSNWLDDENLIQVVGHTQLNYHPASLPHICSGALDEDSLPKYESPAGCMPYNSWGNGKSKAEIKEYIETKYEYDLDRTWEDPDEQAKTEVIFAKNRNGQDAC